MRKFLLRKLYEFLWWMADNASGSDIQVGFYRRFKKPADVRDDELSAEVDRLGNAISQASEMRA